MASIINASTSAGLVQTADTSGILQLQSNGTTIATISSTGLSTQVGNPTFSAYLSANQNISNATATKVTFDVEEFDTNNNFASSRFTPTIAGYYRVSSCVAINGTSGQTFAAIYKNGSEYKRGNQLSANSVGGQTGNVVTATIYCNGTTDYIEIYGYQSSGGTVTIAVNPYTYVTGEMVRSA